VKTERTMFEETQLQAQDRLYTLHELIALLQQLRQYHSQIGDRHIEALEVTASKLAEKLA
jgi:hypothetical protein